MVSVGTFEIVAVCMANQVQFMQMRKPATIGVLVIICAGGTSNVGISSLTLFVVLVMSMLTVTVCSTWAVLTASAASYELCMHRCPYQHMFMVAPIFLMLTTRRFVRLELLTEAAELFIVPITLPPQAKSPSNINASRQRSRFEVCSVRSRARSQEL